MPHATTSRILFIDAYDSFSNNIISLIESSLNVDVTVIKIDESIDDFATFVKPFSAVIAGPGPGHPKNPNDVGLINELWKLQDDDTLPVLGVCLGFQSLVMAFGGTIEPLPQPRHGIVRMISSNGESIFKGIGDIEAVQYHSLHASIGQKFKEEQCEIYQLRDLWTATEVCPDLKPLAWDLEIMSDISGSTTRSLRNPSGILMAVAHVRKPFYGIQFHPESTCSNANAQKVIGAWWNLARTWKTPTLTRSLVLDRCLVATEFEAVFIHREKVFIFKPQRFNEHNVLTSDAESSSTIQLQKLGSSGISKLASSDTRSLKEVGINSNSAVTLVPPKVLYQSLSLDKLDVPSIIDALKVKDGEFMLLDSELYQKSEIGTHSIIGIISPDSLRLEYYTAKSEVRQIKDGKLTMINLEPYDDNIFSYLKMFMATHKVCGGSQEIPFWGGLIGYISYEACLETINISSGFNPRSQRFRTRNPDLGFVFVERSIVIDHQHQHVHIQSIKLNDHLWINRTASLLLQATSSKRTSTASLSFLAQITPPVKSLYKSRIQACQKSIRAGDAYELCLTTQSSIKVPKNLPTWPLYLRLRSLNPAPFSGYIRLGRLTLFSSSPERFLSWTRPASLTSSDIGDNTKIKNQSTGEKVSKCQFRPIKGTVKRMPNDPNSPPITLAQATAILSTPKEQAENLMIVDLIRHDLHGVVGSGNVHVSKLMVVEEYATLYQLVTVVEGLLRTNEENSRDFLRPESRGQPTSSLPRRKPQKSRTGIDVLAASLPPGSMTGAPKRRACTLLQNLENRPRGVYSGVLGYLDVGGGGDFAVVIRSAFRWDADCEGQTAPDGNRADFEARETDCKERVDRPGCDEDEWTVGAGGAVTILSTEEGEWEEMNVKMKTTMRLFEE